MRKPRPEIEIEQILEKQNVWEQDIILEQGKRYDADSYDQILAAKELV
jgi:hypothetical protein